MLEQVLPHGRPVLHHPHIVRQLGVGIPGADLGQGPLTLLDHVLFEFDLAGFHHPFDVTGRKSAIGDEPRHGPRRHFSLGWIKGREQDRIRGIIDDYLDPRGHLKSPHIASLLADNAALDALVGQSHRRRG